jgi:hypothetical protein
MSLPTNISLIGGTIAGGGPPGESYSFNNAPASITEGISETIYVITTAIANGTVLYWTVTPPGEYSTTSGSFSITNNVGTITIIAQPIELEGGESSTIQIRTGSISGPIVASHTFTINDDANGTKYALYGPSGQYYVSEGGSVYTFIWGDIGVGSSSGSPTPVNSGGYTYSVGSFMDSITGKSGSTSFYEIIRTNT